MKTKQPTYPQFDNRDQPCEANGPLLRGVIPPMVTPLTGPDTLDQEGLERLIRRLLSGRVNGIFLLGTTGEGPGLSYRLRRELVERTCRLVAGKVPVLVGITDTACTEALRLAACAADAGAWALVTSAPYYFPASQKELAAYIKSLAARLPLPLFLYNMPLMTKISFGIETVRSLLHVPGIVGIKDSSGDLEYFQELAGLTQQRPDWTVLIGQEHLLPEAIRLGGHGVVAGGANCFPGLFARWHQAALAGEAEVIEALRREVVELSKIYRIGADFSSCIKGLKTALSLLGVCDDAMAEPFTKFSQPEREKLADVLRRLRHAQVTDRGGSFLENDPYSAKRPD